MREKKFIAILAAIILSAVSSLGSAAPTEAASINYIDGKMNDGGRIIRIKGNTIYYQVQLSSSPERWGRLKKAKLTRGIKCYKAVSVVKAKKTSKKSAVKYVKKYVSNYNSFIVKNAKVTTWVYGVNKYVG